MHSVGRKEAQAAAKGPHGHWATFDESLECARYHALDDLVALASFPSARAEDMMTELEEGARSYGYGTEDSFLADAAGLDESSDYATALREMHDNPQDNDEYLIATDRSVNILLARASTAEAQAFVRSIAMRVQDAFTEGRKARAENDGSAEQPKP